MLAQVVETLDNLESGVSDAKELLEMAVEEDDEEAVEEVRKEVKRLASSLAP